MPRVTIPGLLTAHPFTTSMDCNHPWWKTSGWLTDWLRGSMSHQTHIIGHIGDGILRIKWPNSVKALKNTSGAEQNITATHQWLPIPVLTVLGVQQLCQSTPLPIQPITVYMSVILTTYKKLIYLQRKRASNMALYVRCKGFSIWNLHGSRVWQTVHCGTICRMNVKCQLAKLESYGAFDSLWPVFNTLVWGEPMNSGWWHLASRN